jgi:uncharacterized protein (TIGR04255 family)
MPFPQSDRVELSQNPLKEVICQLRFPRILRIDSTSPTDFQERIRSTHPEYEESNLKRLPDGMPPEIAKLLAGIPGSSNESRNLSFTNADGTSKITLSSQFLAVTTNAYSNWSSFQELVKGAVDALQEVYSPSYYKRVGLRYINIMSLTRETELRPVGELVHPALLGPITDPDIGAKVQSHAGQSVVSLSCGGSARINYEVKSIEDRVFTLDSDFYIDECRMDWEDSRKRLSAFNQSAGNLFRWATKPFFDKGSSSDEAE